MYSVVEFGRMIRDGVRMDAYLAAMQRAVRPGCSVLDIGAGTGIFALLACGLGARTVYAVEPLEAIYAAERIAADNGCGGKIRLLRGSSLEIALPERVDLIVSDMRGVLPLFAHHIPAIVDARERLLAPGGALIPRRDRIWAAPLTLPEWYAEVIDGLAHGPMALDLSVMRGVMANSTHRLAFGRDAVLGEPCCWADLDYGRIVAADVRGDLDWALEDGGTVHGIGLWFETELDEAAGFSTGPGGPETIYGRLVLPLMEPLILAPRDRLALMLEARLLGEEYLWRWDTRVWGQHESPPVTARLSQSTFHAGVFSSEQLRLQADDFTPSLDTEGRWTRLALSLMDGHHPLREIARQLAEQFPSIFPRLDDALPAVKGLARQFGR